jgi:hypothetical protein
MDFRGPDVGDFVYHCHILGHEDRGMMAIIQVLPPASSKLTSPEPDHGKQVPSLEKTSASPAPATAVGGAMRGSAMSQMR